MLQKLKTPFLITGFLLVIVIIVAMASLIFKSEDKSKTVGKPKSSLQPQTKFEDKPKDIKIDYSGLFERYVADVEDLKNAYDKILKVGPTLDECQRAYNLKKKDDDARRFKVSLKASIIAGIILAIISFLAGNYFKSSKTTVPQPIESKIDNSGPKK